MTKKSIDYSILEDLVGTKTKTIDVDYVEPTKNNLRKLIKLAKFFNKAVSIKVWKYKVKIDKKTKLKDVFERCRKIEAERMKPLSPKQREEALQMMRDLPDDGPYSGFMSG